MSRNGLFDLSGKTAAIIGGGSGIGKAVAIGAAALGASVVVLDANEPAAAATGRGDSRRRLGAGRHRRHGVGRRRDGDDRARARPGRHPRLHAEHQRPEGILDYTNEEFDRVVAVNLKGTFNVLKATGRIMAAQRGGSIVFFSSIRSVVVEPGQSVYAMTKAGIAQLVRAGAAEFGAYNVRVNAVAPGVVETPLTAPIKANADWYAAYANKSALKRWARADEMVGPTLFLVSDAASYVTGTVLFADGGWTAIDGRFTPPGM